MHNTSYQHADDRKNVGCHVYEPKDYPVISLVLSTTCADDWLR